MRTCFVSSYPPQRCGIAAYTAALAGGLRATLRDTDDAPVVLSERAAADAPAPGEIDGIRALPTFRRSDDYPLAVAARASELRADVVHVQHSADILGTDERLPRLLALLRGRGIRTVVTFHTVHSPATALIERDLRVLCFQRNVGEVADAIVVHGFRAMADVLLRQGVPGSKIHVVPHGTEIVEQPSREEARERLGLPPRGPLLLYFGFVHPQKSVHTLLLAMRTVAEKTPDAILCIAGSVQNPTAVNRAYAAWLGRLGRRRALRGRVLMRPGFAGAWEAPLLHRAADVVLLPYREGYGSASGVAHQAVGAGSLPLCSRAPKFRELAEAIDESLVVPSRAPAVWADAVVRLLEDAPRRARLAERARDYARATAWPRIGAEHATLYASLCRS